MKRLLLLIWILCLIYPTCAQTVEQLNIDVRADGFARVTEKLIFSGQGEHATLELLNNVKEVTVEDELGGLRFNHTNNFLKIFFRDYQETNDSDNIQISYGTHHMTKRVNENWIIEERFHTSGRKTIVKIGFAKGSRIMSINPQNLLRSYVKDGIWIYPQEDEIDFSIAYQYDIGDISTTTSTIPMNNGISLEDPPDDQNVLYGIIIGILFFVILFGVYTLYRQRLLGNRKGTNISIDISDEVVAKPEIIDGNVIYDIKGGSSGLRTVKESILKMLNENELMIIRLLEESTEDEITQAFIQKTTGIPKSSLSDILKHIEKRKIIERRVEGRVKWIKLRTWVFT